MSAPAAIDVFIEGVGLWSASLPGWDSGRAILRGEAQPPVHPAARPAPTLLPPNERRRAPDSVLLAFEIAQQACAMAGRDPGSMPAVFASAYGDLADQRLSVRHARAIGARSVADQVPQFRAQRAGRLLGDCDRLHGQHQRGQRRRVRRSAPACSRLPCWRQPRACRSSMRPTTLARADRWPTSSRAVAHLARHSCWRRGASAAALRCVSRSVPPRRQNLRRLPLYCTLHNATIRRRMDCRC